jgi:hypothetical protein
MKELQELRDMLCDELKEYGKEGKLSAGSLGTIDTLAHALKNLDKVIEDDGSYSGSYPWAYDDGMRRGSYARGRSIRRDGMGRYSGEGYSRHSLSDKLRDLMEEAPDDRTRSEIQRLVEKIDG